MAQKKPTPKSQQVKLTRDLLAKALTWHCPRYTRNGGPGQPPHACDELDGTFSNCPGPAGLCSRVFDIFRTMVKIKNGEIQM